MRNLTNTALVVLTLITVVAAGPKNTGPKDKDDYKTRVYDAAFDRVWDASVASANDNNFVIEHAERDSGVIRFHAQGFYESHVGVVVQKTDDGKVKVSFNSEPNSFIWHPGKHIAKKFFEGVEKHLK